MKHTCRIITRTNGSKERTEWWGCKACMAQFSNVDPAFLCDDNEKGRE